MEIDPSRVREKIQERSGIVGDLQAEIGKVIVGQGHLVERLLISLFSGGHALLEGVPGLAKTTAVKTLADAVRTDFQRIQFTPDLLPADLTGTLIYNPQSGAFTVRKGPIFSHIILADEINRAPAKVQSALLEAMQEKRITIGDETHTLTEPFLVLATQNPIEQEGTYPLPEAQVDRFMLKIQIGYPARDEEKEIMERAAAEAPPEVRPVITPEEVLEIRSLIGTVYLDDKVRDYVLDIVGATRTPKEFRLDLDGYIEYGASPRASIYLAAASRAAAFLKGRGYVTPQDVKNVAPDVLRHRVIVTYEAEAEDLDSEAIVRRILDEVPVP
jgi:MoxR-like ATPase